MPERKRVRMCKLCRHRPAEVPDRERHSSVWRVEVCLECHAERLKGDLRSILDLHERREDGHA